MTTVDAPVRNGRSSSGAPAGDRPRRSRLRRPRVDVRLAVGVVLVAVSVAGGLRLAALGDDTVAVVVAARDLPANHVVTDGDLTTVRIQASDAVLDPLVAGGRIASLEGRVLLGPVAEGGLVDRRFVGSAARPEREITIPITPEHALGGALRTGERVDVLASFGKGTGDARTLTVVTGAEVVATVREEGFLGHDGKLSALTLAVPPDDVVFLAFASRNGELDVVRATGADRPLPERFESSELP